MADNLAEWEARLHAIHSRLDAVNELMNNLMLEIPHDIQNGDDHDSDATISEMGDLPDHVSDIVIDLGNPGHVHFDDHVENINDVVNEIVVPVQLRFDDDATVVLDHTPFWYAASQDYETGECSDSSTYIDDEWHDPNDDQFFD